MNKTTFTYQKWFLKIFCAGSILPFLLVIQYLFSMLMKIEHANMWYIAICIIIALTGNIGYYKYAHHKKWFERKGYYWVENKIVYIQKKNKIYKLENVKWLRGTTISAYGIAKSGMLVIQFEKSKIILVSSSTEAVNDFSDSELLHLFETILEYNPKLKKDGTIDYWYELKE